MIELKIPVVPRCFPYIITTGVQEWVDMVKKRWQFEKVLVILMDKNVRTKPSALRAEYLISLSELMSSVAASQNQIVQI